MDETTQELQSKIAFLERTVEMLNEVVIEKGSEIEALEQRLTVLERRLVALMEDGDERRDPLDERPPHY